MPNDYDNRRGPRDASWEITEMHLNEIKAQLEKLHEDLAGCALDWYPGPESFFRLKFENGLTFAVLHLVADFFGTDDINIGADADSGACDTCDYGEAKWVELDIFSSPRKVDLTVA